MQYEGMCCAFPSAVSEADVGNVLGQ
jgi:hypothetical protein